MGKSFFPLMTVAALLMAAIPATAQTPLTPGTLTYQGRLLENGIRANGTYNMSFKLYSAASGGLAVASYPAFGAVPVAVTDGLFTQELAFVPGNIFAGNVRWLEVVVNGTPLTPRQELTQTAYADYALKAPWSGLTGMPAGFADGVDDTGLPQPPITITTNTQSFVLSVDNTTSIPNLPTFGLRGSASGSLDAAAPRHGVEGVANVANGVGVYGASTNGTGVEGNGGTYGVRGVSSAGIAVRGTRTSGTGTSPAIYGESASGTNTAPAIHGKATAANGTTRGVFGESLSSGGTGVYGSCAAGIGVYGISTNGTALLGYGAAGKALYAFADTGQAGLFEVRSPSSSSNALEVTTVGNSNSQAIFALHTGAGDCGLFEIDNPASAAEAVEARTNGSGDAVQAINSGTGRAGYFQNSSASNGAYALYARTDGNGVAAQGEHAQSGNYGFLASTDFGAYGYNDTHGNVGFLGGQAYGVYGINNEFSAPRWGYIGGRDHGVYGANSRTWGYLGGNDHGVVGVATNGNFAAGVYGEGSTNVEFGLMYGVYGKATTPHSENAYGVYANGNFAASGTKQFQIDHPLDPENKYLHHFCTEGAEPLNNYSGNVLLDETGQAWVQLPGYFEAINADVRYQLTPIGAPAPNLHVARKVENNRFLIAGGAPGLEISWNVTGRRNDPYLRAHPQAAERPKLSTDRGKYIHPDLYGQPPEKAILPSSIQPSVPHLSGE